MSPSYSSYKNDLLSFNSEEYIKIFHNSDSFNLFNIFINNYKEIENEDFKKPIFSQTTKFKKTPSNYKNYKYLKINRDNDDNKDYNNENNKHTWNFESPIKESEKISILIKTYLNKISEDTYKKISNEFIEEIVLIKNDDIFNILCKEILNKCLFDNKYRNLYINLCYKIWTNKQIHYNIINLTSENEKYYWNINESKLNGPFTSEINAKIDAYQKINFKKFFLNYIQNLFINKDLSFECLNEEEIFIKKKKILLLVELIGILFLEKYINFDIIHIIIIDLLHLNNNFNPIEEIEYESLYILIKLIKDNKNSFNDLIEFKNIFIDYNDIINKIINNNKLSKRSTFFLLETIQFFKCFIKNDKNDKNCQKKENDNNTNTKIFFDMLKNNHSYEDLLNIYKKFSKNLNNEEYKNFIHKLIDSFINDKKNNSNIIFILNEINNEEIIYNSMEVFINNIEDILLDIPDANEKLIYIMNTLKYNHIKKNDFIEILENMNSDSESD